MFSALNSRACPWAATRSRARTVKQRPAASAAAIDPLNERLKEGGAGPRRLRSASRCRVNFPMSMGASSAPMTC